MQKLLNKEHACRYLNISEVELEELVEKGRLVTYKVGGAYLRFREEDLLAVKPLINKDQELESFMLQEKPKKSKEPRKPKRSFFDGIWDFLYYNDFYILGAIIILLLLAILFNLSL